MGGNNMVNFTGVWFFDPEKSELQSPPPETSIFNITYCEQAFSLDRTHIVGGLPDRFTIELKLNGTEADINLRGVNITAKMYWEQDTLVCDMLLKQGKEEAVNIVKYSLLDEGETLVADEYFESCEYKQHNKWVFNKKEHEPV